MFQYLCSQILCIFNGYHRNIHIFLFLKLSFHSCRWGVLTQRKLNSRILRVKFSWNWPIMRLFKALPCSNIFKYYLPLADLRGRWPLFVYTWISIPQIWFIHAKFDCFGRFVMENWYFAFISLHEIAYFGPSDVKVRFWFSIFPCPVCLKTFYSFLFFSITTGQTKFGTARPRELKNEGRGW